MHWRSVLRLATKIFAAILLTKKGVSEKRGQVFDLYEKRGPKKAKKGVRSLIYGNLHAIS